MKMVLVFLMLFQCHQDSVQCNIISVLLDITLKHNLNKLLNSFNFLFVPCQGYQNFSRDHVGVPKLFARCFKKAQKNF